VLTGYTVQDEIFSSLDTQVFRAIADGSGIPVVLKIKRKNLSDPQQHNALAEEARIYQLLDNQHWPRFVEYQSQPDFYGLALEAIEGKSLDSILHPKPSLQLEAKLNIAIQIAEALEYLHQAGYVHRDINPSNIIVDEHAERVQLIDLGLAVSTESLRESYAECEGEHPFSGTVAYMAPEQTGRVGKPIDARSDLYSTGATIYELFTGRRPFRTRTDLETIHAHIAIRPTAPSQINESVPVAISAVIQKLLAKSPEDRYQSAFGLRKDLERCKTDFGQDGEIKPFAVGRFDISEYWRFPEKLYGRDDDLTALVETYEKIAESPKMAVVSGYTGVGKSSLCNVFLDQARSDGVFVAEGKFDQLRGEEPFSALKLAVTQLAQAVMRLDPVLLDKWKARLSQLSGKEGYLLTDFVPELSSLLDSDQKGSDLSSEEASSRFIVLLGRFLKIFTEGDNRLLLFLDDIQWIDPATLRFMRAFFQNDLSGACLIVGAFRSNEIDESHLFQQGIRQFQEKGVEVRVIELEELSPDAMGQMLQDTFHLDINNKILLQKLVASRAGGNPYFVKELVTSLCEANSIRFDHRLRSWSIDEEKIANREVAPNLTELVRQRVMQLPDLSRRILSIAACAGVQFRSELIYEIAGESVDACTDALLLAEERNIVFRQKDKASVEPTSKADEKSVYRFSHDQIQVVCYEFLSGTERQEIHLSIGRSLLTSPHLENGGGFSYIICDQFNKGLSLVTNQPELSLTLDLNLNAAVTAKKAGALSAASKYIDIALSLLSRLEPGDLKAMEYQTWIEAARIYHAVGQPEISAQYSERAKEYADNRLEAAAVYNLDITRLTQQGRYQQAIELAIDILRSLDIELEETQFEQALEKEIELLPTELDAEILLADLSERLMEDEQNLIAMRIMMNLFPASHAINPALNGWLAAKMVSLTLCDGFAPESPKGLVNYGSLLALRGDFESGYQFGKMAVSLTDKLHAPQLKPRVLYAFLGDLVHWKEPLINTRDMVDEAYLCCLEYGESGYAGYVLSFARCMNEVFLGEDLELFEKKAREAVMYARSTQNRQAEGVALATHMAVSHLLKSKDSTGFDTDLITESQFLLDCESHEDYAAIALLRILQTQNYIILQRNNDAERALKAALRHGTFFSTGIPMAMLTFFEAVVRLNALQADSTNKYSEEREIQKVDKCLSVLAKWSQQCPENFTHLLLFAEGCRKQFEGNDIDAISSLSQSAEYAAKQGFIQFSALAHEYLANIWRQLGNQPYLRSHINSAYEYYLLWNTRLKVKTLRHQFGFLAKPARTSRSEHGISRSTTSNQSSTSRQEELDFAAISEVTNSISQEINFDELLNKIAKSITEVSGANKYALFLKVGSSQELELRFYLFRNKVDPSKSRSRDENLRYPQGIINYVSRTQEVVRVSEPEIQHYASDPYFKQNHPKSILCLPILLQGRLLGIMYLENSELENIFTPERLNTISIISNQAGISIHNSLQFANLEREVENKTRDYLELASNLEIKVQQQVSEIETLNGFKRFVSPPVAKMLASEQGKELLKSHRKEIAILFCDLRGFTAYSESVEPEEAVDMLNQYHAAVGRLVNKYNATIDHRAGDGLMIFLNDPYDTPEPIKAIVEFAIELRENVNNLLTSFKNMGDKIGFGIGIAYGYSTIGMVGFDGRFDYAASGRYVNLASRLCDIAEDGQIVVSNKVALSDQILVNTEPDREVLIKGFHSPIQTYLL